MTEQEKERLQALEEENRALKELVQSEGGRFLEKMGQFLSEEVLEEIIQQHESTPIGGERKVVTILFCDLRRSTELSEQMEPNDFITMLNHFLGEMIEIINAWQGNILSFVGDAIIAVFGAPRPNEQAARDAVACAVAMQRRMQEVNRWNAETGYPDLSMGVGIHTGEVIIGNIGSQTRAKYDVIGRNVNLASRIEGFTDGGQILISRETRAAAGDQVVFNEANTIWVKPKGIQGEVQLFDVVGFGQRRIPETRIERNAKGTA